MPMLPLLLIALGAAMALGLVLFAFAGPSAQKASTRRLAAVRERHTASPTNAIEAQMRRITGRSATKADLAAMRKALTALVCQCDAGAMQGNCPIIHALGVD